GLDAVGEVAVGVQRIDQHGGDRGLARVEAGEVELPQQVLLQGLGCDVLRLEILVAARGAAAAAPVGEVDRGFDAAAAIVGPIGGVATVDIAIGGGLGGAGRLHVVGFRRGLVSGDLVLALVGEFQQRIAFGKLPQLGL